MVILGFLLSAAGYWGPWVAAEAVGLRVLGLDIAEYVKFIAEVRSGQLVLQREVFYIPLATLSLSLSLLAHRPDLRIPTWMRWLLNLLAVPVALAMLPPAWTPPLLRTPEFIKQTIAIVLCSVAAVASYPLLRRLPRLPVALLITVLSVAAIVPPIATFYRLQAAFAAIYGNPVQIGYGPAVMALGFTLLALGAWLTSPERQNHPKMLRE
jgi:hypothetical protein